MSGRKKFSELKDQMGTARVRKVEERSESYGS